MEEYRMITPSFLICFFPNDHSFREFFLILIWMHKILVDTILISNDSEFRDGWSWVGRDIRNEVLLDALWVPIDA